MRRARTVTLLEQDGAVQGIVLEGDHCSEHEHGIDNLKMLLDIQTSQPTGIDQRSMTGPLRRGDALYTRDTKVKEHLFVRERPVKVSQKTTPVTVLSVQPSRSAYEEASEADKRILRDVGCRYAEDQEAVATWDESGFTILAYSERMRAALKDLAAAVRSGDFGAWTGRLAGNNPFAPFGLVLCIPSRVPDEPKQTMLAADNDRNALQAAAAATGIAERIRGANASATGGQLSFGPYAYFALSPAWAAGGLREGDTKYPVIFFLNPGQQRVNNHGWFTVEELDLWLLGQGPIPKGPPAKVS